MNKYLQELLKLAKTVIIPGLGALTITNDKTSEIFFMSYLKHDDGKLAEFIASKEGIEIIDAKNNLAKYVREIIALLDKGESFDIFNFGKFIKDASGEIVFEQSSKIEHKLSESTFSIDVSEKLAAHLEITPEIDSDKNQIKEQPSLDTILNEKIDLAIEDKNKEEEIIEKDSISSGTTDKQENFSIEITDKDLKEEKPLNEDSVEKLAETKDVEKETNSSSSVEIKITEGKSSASLKKNSDEKFENTKPEVILSTKKQDKKESITTNKENIAKNSSEPLSLEEKTEIKIVVTNSESKKSSENQSKKEKIESIPFSPKKNVYKKRIIGILIPTIIASFTFLYPKLYNSSNKSNDKASLVEHEEIQADSQKLKDSTKNIPSEAVKVEEAVQESNTVSQPVTPTITPTPVATTKTKPVYQQPINTTIPKTNVTAQIQVIVGSFTQKDNALKFNQTLIQKGYTNGTIIENGGVVLLSLGSFPTVQEAANFGRTLKLPTGYWLKAIK